MKSLIAISLALLVSAPFLLKTGVLSYWLYNRDYIAANLCINRDIPGSDCQGKCFLMQKIKGIDAPAGADVDIALSLLKSGLSDFSLKDIWPFSSAGIILQSTKTNQHYYIVYSFLYLKSLLQPPEPMF